MITAVEKEGDSLIGAIIGDIVGSRFEFYNHKTKEFELLSDECFVTDDTIMTLSIADALMNTGFEELSDVYLKKLSMNTISSMHSIGRHYPHCGYGSRFYRWLFNHHPEPYNSYGNGAAMRVSAIVDYAKSIEEVILLSRAVTEITHSHHEGIKGAEATAVAIYLAKNGSTVDKIQEYIEEHYYQLDFTIDEIRPSYKFDVTCQGTVPQAIKAFVESNSFEDAIRIAISLGGDSDTLTAITGSIAEAYYGVPGEIEKKALSYLDERLLDIYKRWQKDSRIFFDYIEK